MINSGFRRTFGALTPFALVLCASSAAFGQGATCATATAVVNNQSYGGTTVGASTYSNSGLCAGSGRPCQWFVYTAPSAGSVTFSTCDSTGTLVDTVISAHSNCTTNSANVLGCDDDGCSNNKSTMAVTVAANQVVYIRVGQFGSSGNGTYTLNVGPLGAPPPPPPPPSIGPDVTVYTCWDVGRYTPVGAITAYAVGTTSFNPGNYPLDWRDEGTSNKAPVIAQNIYKLKNGRFTQVGQSWLKHGFLSLNSPPDAGTGSCNTPPLGGAQLGINCTDLYTSGNNSAQSNLGPRSVVNATTGYYPPVANSFASGSSIYKRLQVASSEMEQTTGGATTKFFAEGHYVNYDDAIWNNGLNNSSWAPINLTSATATPTVSPTIRREPAIKAWGANDASVVTVNADHTYTLITAGTTGDLEDAGTHYTVLPTLPIDITCRYIVACKVTDNGNGTWHYEYCVYNHNSDRSGYSFSLRLPANAVTSGEGMYFPFSHSGEPYTNTPWTADKTQAGMLTFKADNTFAGNPNANALRWGTMYTFWFDANVAPMAGQGKVTLFKPAYAGTDASNAAGAPSGRTGNDLALWAFANGLQVPAYCPADIATTGGALGPDGITNVDDLVAFLAQFFAGNIAVADLATLGGGTGSAGDGQLTVDDLVFFLSAFFSNCN